MEGATLSQKTGKDPKKCKIFEKELAHPSQPYKICLSKDCSGGNNRPSDLWFGGLYLFRGFFLFSLLSGDFVGSFRRNEAILPLL